MSDTLRPGAYDGHALQPAEDACTCDGQRLIEVEYHVGDEPAPAVPSEAGCA
jgi:hypothetical protein